MNIILVSDSLAKSRSVTLSQAQVFFIAFGILAAGFMLAIAAVAYAQGQENTYDVSGKVSPAKAGSSKKPVPSFGKTQEPRKTFTDEEKDQLREVMKSPKMSDKDRAELRKALMGNKKK